VVAPSLQKSLAEESRAGQRAICFIGIEVVLLAEAYEGGISALALLQVVWNHSHVAPLMKEMRK
jgi:hypothetical protein